MSVDHSGADILVAEEFLHGSYVVSVFEQMSGEAVAERMTRRGFADTGLAHRAVDSLLHGGFREMMTADDLRARVF